LHASATREEKIELALIMKPLLERLIDNPFNTRSSYNYYKKQQVQFFPRRSIPEFSESHFNQLDINGKVTELNKLYPDNFYTKRPIKLKDPKNRSILDYID